ncbi:hypothetical protein ACLOJK_007776 [Asimina triloba]
MNKVKSTVSHPLVALQEDPTLAAPLAAKLRGIIHLDLDLIKVPREMSSTIVEPGSAGPSSDGLHRPFDERLDLTLIILALTKGRNSKMAKDDTLAEERDLSMTKGLPRTEKRGISEAIWGDQTNPQAIDRTNTNEANKPKVAI